MDSKNDKQLSCHVFIILFILVLIASGLTYIIPKGEFTRVYDAISKQTLIVPDSYKLVAANPIAPWNIPYKFFKAITSASSAQLIVFILIIGGSFEIVMQTGSPLRVCEVVLHVFYKKKIWSIPVFVALFSIFGFTMGFATASIIFVPIGIMASKILNFDKLTGAAMVVLGTNAGFAAGIFNPFSVGVAQTIAELPLYSGAGLRVVLLIVLLIVTSAYIMYYEQKVFATYKLESSNLQQSKQKLNRPEISLRQKLVIIEFVMFFVGLTYGVSQLRFETEDIAVLFLLMGIVTGLTAGFGANKVCEIFIDGAKKMVKGAFVIGIAATLRLVLADGMILDTITYDLTGMIYQLPRWAQLTGMFYANALIDLVITSASSHAAVVMPIMTAMADFLGISRQSAVLAFQLGDGLLNLTSPVSTTLTGLLAVSELSYGKWIKFFVPLVVIYIIVGTVFVIVAGMVGY